jgi:hypothetical protein
VIFSHIVCISFLICILYVACRDSLFISRIFLITPHFSLFTSLSFPGTLFPYALLEPIAIYYTLLQDSKWWLGLDIMQGRREAAAEEIRSPMAGLDLSINSAQSLAASMDNMSLGKLLLVYV